MEKDENLTNFCENYRYSIASFNTDELLKEKKDLEDQISKMIMNSDTVLKIAIVEARLEELTNGKTK